MMLAYILIFTFVVSACGATPTPQVIVVTATSLPATEAAPSVVPTATFAPVALTHLSATCADACVVLFDGDGRLPSR